MGFLEWLEQLSFSQWVLSSGSVWAYPTILTLHTAGMMTVAGLTAVICLRLLGLAPGAPIQAFARLLPYIWWGFGLNALTGLILLVADATTKLTNPDFYVKMGFIFAGLWLLRRIRIDVLEAAAPRHQRTLAWASVACWTGAITAGRLLAYLGPVSGVKGLTNH